MQLLMVPAFEYFGIRKLKLRNHKGSLNLAKSLFLEISHLSSSGARHHRTSPQEVWNCLWQPLFIQIDDKIDT